MSTWWKIKNNNQLAHYDDFCVEPCAQRTKEKRICDTSRLGEMVIFRAHWVVLNCGSESSAVWNFPLSLHSKCILFVDLFEIECSRREVLYPLKSISYFIITSHFVWKNPREVRKGSRSIEIKSCTASSEEKSSRNKNEQVWSFCGLSHLLCDGVSRYMWVIELISMSRSLFVMTTCKKEHVREFLVKFEECKQIAH
jgi:hypothetical protein